MAAQERGGFQDDGGSDQTAGRDEPCTDASDNAIGEAETWRARSRAVEDQQLLLDEHGFGHHGTESTGPRQSGHGDDQVNEHDTEIAHPGNRINTSQTTALQANLAIRHASSLEWFF